MVKRKQKSPPFMSHEFIIQNHADILAVLLMVVFFGLLLPALVSDVQVTKDFSKTFYEYQHGVFPEAEEDEAEDSDPRPKIPLGFGCGLFDVPIIIFQTIILTIIQAVIQEYFLDKYSKRFHLSKTKHSRFNESAQVIIWFASSTCYALNIILNQKFFESLSSIWESYPEKMMSWEVKAFMIAQIAYWLHMYGELYFGKVRKEEINFRVRYYTLHLFFITAAYFLYMWKLAIVGIFLHYLSETLFHFSKLAGHCERKQLSAHAHTAWSVVFPFTRTALAASVGYVFIFKLPETEAASLLNSFTTRLVCALSMGLSQVWLFLQFISLQLRRQREAERLRNLEKPKPKAEKKKPQGKKAAAGGGAKKVKAQ